MATTVKILVVTEDRGSGPLRTVGDSARGAGDSAEGAGEKVKGFGSNLWQMGDAATNAGGLITEHITQPFLETITVAGDFEANLNRFSSVTGASLGEAGLAVGDFRDLFLEMGADTQFSAAEAGDAAINMAKGGIDPAIIAAGGLAEVLGLAAAGELDLAQAAEISAKQFGVWADQSASAADQSAFLGETANLLAQAANASTVDVEDLALGLANAGGSAKIAGLDFGETVQTMALLAPGFSSAADAGTSFKTFLANLQPSTNAQADAMRSLGLFSGLTAGEYSKLEEKVGKLDAAILQLDPTTKNYAEKLRELQEKKALLVAQMENGRSAFYDEEGSFIGMEAAAQKLHEATKGLTEEQRIQTLQTIFGSDAIRAAAIIAEQGGEGFRGMGEDMAAAGTAAEQATEKNQGFNFALESMKGSVETLQIQLGEKLLPAGTRLINEFLIPAVNWFGELDPGMQTAAIGVVGFLAVLGPGLLILGGVASGVTAITGAFTVFSTAAPAFGAAWAIATGPVGLVVLGIAGIVAAIVAVKAAWDSDFMGFRTNLIAWGTDLKEGLGVVGAFFGEWGNKIQTGWNRLQRGAGTLVTGITSFFTGIPGNLVNVGQDIVDGLWNGLQNAWQGLLNNTSGLVSGFVDGFKSALGIRSPSTVFAALGEDGVGAGLVVGLERKRQAVLDAGAGLAGAAVGGAQRGTQGAATTVAGGQLAMAGTPAGETHYHLHINTSAPTEPILQDFAMLRAMAG